ncbi:MAG: dihydroorotate dehydrogenase [archaeon]|nr:dihydroorotate dehydrogenase [archaeon]
MGSLKTTIGKLEFTNPSILASGIMDETGLSMARVLDSGAGAVVSKSIGTKANLGHVNPCFLEVTSGYINSMGLPNPGIDAYKKEMEMAIIKGKVIGSIYGASAQEFVELAGKMEDFGACAIELNLSCPHAKGYGIEVGTDPKIVKDIVVAVKSSIKIPVWAKLTPNTHILSDIGRAVENGGGDAVVAINTLKAMVIEPEFAKPVLSNKIGGLSGNAIKPVGVRAVYDLRESISIPIIGTGGISNYRDALEYIMAGASAFQIGSAIFNDGPEIFRKICGGISKFMKRYGYDSIESMVGIAHE